MAAVGVSAWLLSGQLSEVQWSKFMTVIDSYRDTQGSIELINTTIPQYREVYKQMGLTLSKDSHQIQGRLCAIRSALHRH